MTELEGLVDTLPTTETDGVLAFEGYHDRVQGSCCRVRVYRDREGRPVIVLTEVPDNPGTSITNRAERAHWLVWFKIGRPWPCRFVEHYPGLPGARAGHHDAERVSELFFAGTSGDGPIEREFVSSGRRFGYAFLAPRWEHRDLETLKREIR